MKRFRGHYCRICGRICPNERFSGRGHATHLCRECQKLPQIERDRVDLMQELEGYLQQSHISDRNLSRLRKLSQHALPEISTLAAILHDIGVVTPFKRRRFKRLAREHRELLSRYNTYFGYTDWRTSEDEWLAMMNEELDPDDMDDWCEPDETEGVERDDVLPLVSHDIFDPFAD